jgi:uncharacterized repeat protein (TIGR03803 family)
MESVMELVKKIPQTLALALGLAMLTPVAASPASAAATFQVLKSMCATLDDSGNCVDGNTPSGTLVSDSSHNIYGATQEGGAHGGGVVFQLLFDPDTLSYRYKVLYDFCDITNCSDGQTPTDAKLVIDASGIIYGTAAAGGGSNNGVVFRLTPNETKSHYHFDKIYEFCVEFSACQDGAKPTGGLTFAGEATGATYDGIAPLYGSTVLGGRASGGGVVYSLTPGTGGGAPKLKQLYKFCHFKNNHDVCTDGANPSGNMVVDKNGNIWGTAMSGGAGNAGIVFELVPTTTGPWGESLPYQFCSETNCTDGMTPATGLAVDSNGNFYGTTSTGGIAFRKCPATGCGVLFKVSSSGSNESTLYSFCSLDKCADGGVPAGVVLDPNGNIYGAAAVGGVHHNGDFFKLTGTTLTDMYDVKCSGGSCGIGIGPSGAMMLIANDDLFGNLLEGGRHGQGGVVFKLSP